MTDVNSPDLWMLWVLCGGDTVPMIHSSGEIYHPGNWKVMGLPVSFGRDCSGGGTLDKRVGRVKK